MMGGWFSQLSPHPTYDQRSR